MASILATSIDLTKIPKDKIIEGKKGKYLPITITINDEPDQFGNNGPVIVQQSFIFAYAVLAEAMLSFLGVGPPPPAPSWGNIISEARGSMRIAPWIMLFPGIAISITVLGINMLGDGLRDVLDPKSRVEGR